MIKKNMNWINASGTFTYADIPDVTEKLPPAIYELILTDQGYKLQQISDTFIMPEKVYGTESEFIKRIITSYTKFNGNLGVLLKGLKGTGKTVTAKQICNTLKIPVILINKAYTNLSSFLNSIDQNIIIFFDEFEKIYELNPYAIEDDENPNSKWSVNHLLTLIDGVFTNEHKKLFIFTINEVNLPDPLENRPSRIRYIKNFENLDTVHVKEILTDLLTNKDLIPEILVFLGSLKFITVDIIKSLAEECNIYNQADKEFLSIFNVTERNDEFNLYEVLKDVEKLAITDFKPRIENMYVGYSFQLGSYGIVTIESLSDEDQIFTAKVKNNSKTIIFAVKPALSIHGSIKDLVF